jgi:hypothetical protein
MPRSEIGQHRIKRKGLKIDFLAPIVDGVNLLKIPDYNTKKITWCDIAITSTSQSPIMNQSRDMRDIDNELAEIDSKWKIIQERLTHKDNPTLINYNQSKETYIRHAIPMNHPFLQGENDKLKKNMTELNEIDVPLEDVRAHEAYLEKKKAFYKSHKFEDGYKVTKNEQTGEKFAKMKIGYI